jgi:hypothetical protein
VSGADGPQKAIQMLLENLRCRCALVDKSLPAPSDNALKLLRDHAALSRARERLKS